MHDPMSVLQMRDDRGRDEQSGQKRVRGEAYEAFIDEFVEAVQALFPKCTEQFSIILSVGIQPATLSTSPLHVTGQRRGLPTPL